MLAGPIAQRVVAHHASPRRGEPTAVVLEDFSGWASVGVSGVVVDKILAREGAVAALGFVEHRDVRLDPAVIPQPVQHLCRAVGGVAKQLDGVEIEAYEFNPSS